MERTDLTTVCPGCGLILPKKHLDPPDRFNASSECWQLFNDLSCYTVARKEADFIHQYAVDAYEAQHAGGPTRNSTVAFGLIGLHLTLEKGYSGKQVQREHMRIAGIRKDWSWLDLPARPAVITVRDVLQVPEGPERDAMIRRWMEVVWESWSGQQERVRETTGELLDR
jgi:hypothetical protein